MNGTNDQNLGPCASPRVVGLEKLFPTCPSGPDKFGTQGPDFAFLAFSAPFKPFFQSLRPKMEYIH